MKKKKYKICEYNHIPDMVSYVNEDTKNPQEGWVTTVPIRGKIVKGIKEQPTPIKYFSSKSEAQEYLDSIKKHRIDDWFKHEHFYKSNGYKKPVWKIYTENED